MSLRRPTPAFLVALATAFSLLGDQALYSVLPVIHSDLGLSALQVGLLLSVNRWIRLLTNEFAHRLAARHAPAYLLPAALLLGAITTALWPGIFMKIRREGVEMREKTGWRGV